MRIVYTVFGRQLAGGEVVCLQLMRAARARGHTPCLLVPSSGTVMDIAEKEGFEVFLFPLERTFQLHRAIQFARFLRRWKADLIHTHTTLPGMVLARLGARLSGIPIVCHVHLEHTYSARWFVRILQRTADNLTAHLSTIIAVSQDTERALKQSGNPANRIHMVPNGIRPNNLLTSWRTAILRTQFGIPSSAPLIGCVARLSPTKGQRELLMATVDICSFMPETHLMLVGVDIARDGAYEHELRVLAAQLGIAQRVHFVGFQENAADLMPGFDVFVLPSYREAMPISVLEAMAAAVPVVATHVNGIPEQVIDGETGILVPPGDPVALAVAILKLLRDPELARRMGQLGRKRIEMHFDLDQLHNTVFDLYEQVVRPHGYNRV